MNRIFKTVLLVAVILMQTTVMAHFPVLGVLPDYTLVTIIAISIVAPETENVVFSALAGLLIDLLTGVPTGVNTLLFLYFSIVYILISNVVYNKSITVFAPLCFLGSYIYEFLIGVSSFLLRGVNIEIPEVFTVSAIVSVVNTIAFIPLYLILKRVKFEKKRKGIKYEQ